MLSPLVAIRSSTTPPFLLLLKQGGGVNSDFFTYHFGGGVYRNAHEPITAIFQSVAHDACAAGGPPACVMDAGMNAGFYSLLFAAMGCHVTAFEVQPELVRLVTLSARLNGFETHLSIHRLAVGSGTGTARIASSKRTFGGGVSVRTVQREGKSDGGGATLGDESNRDDDESVLRTASLDDLIDAQPAVCGRRLAALKLDVESYELFALHGLRRALRSQRVDHIIFEFGGATRWARHNQSAENGVAALEALADAGYEIRLIHQRQLGTEKILSLRGQVQNWRTGQGSYRGAVFTYSTVPRSGLRVLVLPTADVNIWAVAKA